MGLPYASYRRSSLQGLLFRFLEALYRHSRTEEESRFRVFRVPRSGEMDAHFIEVTETKIRIEIVLIMFGFWWQLDWQFLSKRGAIGLIEMTGLDRFRHFLA